VTELDVERGRAHPREVAPTRRTRHLIPHHSQQGPLPTSSLIASKLNSRTASLGHQRRVAPCPLLLPAGPSHRGQPEGCPKRAG
jgi:hypothetical protein